MMKLRFLGFGLSIGSIIIIIFHLVEAFIPLTISAFAIGLVLGDYARGD